jgi:hypothetical protein
MSTPSTPLTVRQKIGIAVFVVFVPILVETYWKQGGELPLIGPVGIGIVALIAAVGGAVSFWLIAEKPETRRIGLLAGALAGCGGVIAFHLVYGASNRAGGERIFVGLAGMLPGFGVGLLLTHLQQKKAKTTPVA